MKLKDEILLAIEDVYEFVTFKNGGISLGYLYMVFVFGSIIICMTSIAEIICSILYFDIFEIIIYIITAIISIVLIAFFIRRFDNEIGYR